MWEAALYALAGLILSIGGGLQALGEAFEVGCIAAGGEYELTSRDYDGQWECSGAVVTVPTAGQS